MPRYAAMVSSRFAKNKRYGYFPSASFAWRASNEGFFPKNKYVNDAKLRLSWGMTGSMAGVSNYAPLSLISAGGASYNGSAGSPDFTGRTCADLGESKSVQYRF